MKLPVPRLILLYFFFFSFFVKKDFSGGHLDTYIQVSSQKGILNSDPLEVVNTHTTQTKIK